MSDDGLPPLREILKQHNLKARKGLGQNFLLDFNVTRKIARLANARPQKHFVEIGPGPGGLTRSLLHEGVDQLTLIERDERVRPILSEISTRYPGSLDIIFDDALSIDWSSLSPSPYVIVGNLPYNIGTALLVDWLSRPWPPEFDQLTLMFQEEVGERIVALPGSRAYGRISALAQWRCDVDILYRLPRDAFTPAPKVASAIVEFRPKNSLELSPSVDVFSRITAAAFGQRRKMLRQSLKSICGDVIELLSELGIDPTARAEDLDWREYCRIALAVDD